MKKFIPVAEFEVQLRIHYIANLFGFINHWYFMDPIDNKLEELGFTDLANKFRESGEETNEETYDGVHHLMPAFKGMRHNVRLKPYMTNFVLAKTKEEPIETRTFVTVQVVTDGHKYEVRALPRKNEKMHNAS